MNIFSEIRLAVIGLIAAIAISIICIRIGDWCDKSLLLRRDALPFEDIFKRSSVRLNIE